MSQSNHHKHNGIHHDFKDQREEVQLFKQATTQRLSDFRNKARGVALKLMGGRERGIEELKGPGLENGVDDPNVEINEEVLLRQLDNIEIPEEEREFDLSKVDPFSEESEERKVLHLFKDRNLGAKEFDDFARGIQSWFSMVELESMRRYHELYVGPIIESMEEHLERAAMQLMDLITKALLLCKLRKYKKGVGEIGRIALEALEKMLQDLGRTVPEDLLITRKVLDNLAAQSTYLEESEAA